MACGGGDGSYSEHARDAVGVGNMPMENDSGGIRVILSDGSHCTGMEDGVEFASVVETRGVVWSGRGVSSGSSWGSSCSTNVRVNDCLGVSSREVCLDGKKRDNGGRREVLGGDDLSERDKEGNEEPEIDEPMDEFQEIGEGWG